MARIIPQVKLEFGARGDPWPTGPYAAADYPDLFEEPDCTITVLSARRTFWKKTAAKKSPTPQYFARHYEDIAMLLDPEDGKAAATS